MQIFLCHSSQDKEIVEAVGNWLTSKGNKVWIDNWCLTAGDSLVDKIGEGIENSDKFIVFLSPNSVDSIWVKKEVSTGLILELAEEKGFGSKFVIPALLKNCKIPIMLRDKIYANYTNKSFDAACKELFNGILDQSTGPLDKKFENSIIRKYDVIQNENARYAIILEFAVKITPTQGLNIKIDLGSKYNRNIEWFNVSGNATIPNIAISNYYNSSKKVEPPIFAINFENPCITSDKSYYIYFGSNEPFHIKENEIIFLDFYNRIP